MEYWWCLTHNRVEEGGGCPNMSRLGPYDSREKAETALERAKERTARQDAIDEAEDDWGKS